MNWTELKEASLKGLNAIEFQLYDILEKETVQRSVVARGDEGERNKQAKLRRIWRQ